MMWAAGSLASVSMITYPAISALVSCNAEDDQQGYDFKVIQDILLHIHSKLSHMWTLENTVHLNFCSKCICAENNLPASLRLASHAVVFGESYNLPPQKLWQR